MNTKISIVHPGNSPDRLNIPVELKEFWDFIHRQTHGEQDKVWIGKPVDNSFRSKFYGLISKIPLIRPIGMAMAGTMVFIGIYFWFTEVSDWGQPITWLGLVLSWLILPLNRYTKIWNTAYAATERGLCFQDWQKGEKVFHYMDYEDISTIYWNNPQTGRAVAKRGDIVIQTRVSPPPFTTRDLKTGQKNSAIVFQSVKNPEDVVEFMRNNRLSRRYNKLKSGHSKNKLFSIRS